MNFGQRILLKQYKNGNKLWGIKVNCMKCNGTGYIPQFFHVSSGVCFDCKGDGWDYEKEIEYTPENLAKREAKLAKLAQKQAEEDARRAEEEARLAEELAQKEAEEEARRAEEEAKRRGHYFGEIGQKIEIDVTYKGCSFFETQFGCMNVYRFDTDDGAHLIWKSSADLGSNKWLVFDGDRITIQATIKDHREYRGIEQTELARVKVIKAVHDYATYPRTNGDLFDYDLVVFPNGEKIDRLGVRWDDERRSFCYVSDDLDEDGRRIMYYSNTIEISKTKLF